MRGPHRTKKIGVPLDYAGMQSVSDGMHPLTDREIDVLNIYLSGATRMEMHYSDSLSNGVEN